MNVLRVGRYRMLQHLGGGATSEVYLAEDMTLRRKVAVKLLRRRDATEDDLKRFETEARCTAMLNHPNIVTVFDLGHEGDVQFIATEYVEGESLRDRLKHFPIELGAVLDIAISVARALVSAHESWIVHRDIKPENIMIRRDGCVKVVDFSISRLVGAGEQTDPVKRRGMGSLHYLSPEQVRNEPIIDTRSDIYSLGIVLHEMLAGAPPFEGEPMDVLAAIVESPMPVLPATVPTALRAIVLRATRKNMYERFQTAAEMLDTLLEAQFSTMLHARTVSE